MAVSTRVVFSLLFLLIPTVAASTPSPQRQQELLHLLRHDCGSCHGMSLKGGLGPALLPPNLTGKSDEFLVDTVLQGRTATAMPPWQNELSREEAIWLVQQLRKGVSHAN